MGEGKSIKRFREFLKLSGYFGSKFGVLQARKLWAASVTRRKLKKPGCIASAYCVLNVNQIHKLLVVTAHSQDDGIPKWASVSGKMPHSGCQVLRSRCAPNVNGRWFRRHKDAEYVLLNSIASKWGPEQLTDGFIVLYVEYPPCDSCTEAIAQFREIYPRVDLVVHWKSPLSTSVPTQLSPVCQEAVDLACEDFKAATGLDCADCKAGLSATVATSP